MTPKELDASKARVEAATPGPWHHDLNGYVAPTVDDGESWGVTVCKTSFAAPSPQQKADAEFIAHAREDIPALIAEVERLRAALNRISEGRGRFSRDQLTFATNVIEDMKRIALEALSPTITEAIEAVEGE